MKEKNSRNASWFRRCKILTVVISMVLPMAAIRIYNNNESEENGANSREIMTTSVYDPDDMIIRNIACESVEELPAVSDVVSENEKTEDRENTKCNPQSTTQSTGQSMSVSDCAEVKDQSTKSNDKVKRSTESPVARNTERTVTRSTESPVTGDTESSVTRNTESSVTRSTESSVTRSTESPVTGETEDSGAGIINVDFSLLPWESDQDWISVDMINHDQDETLTNVFPDDLLPDVYIAPASPQSQSYEYEVVEETDHGTYYYYEYHEHYEYHMDE